ILRLKIKRKHIGQSRIECCRNVAHGPALLWPTNLFRIVCPSGGLSHSDPRYLSFRPERVRILPARRTEAFYEPIGDFTFAPKHAKLSKPDFSFRVSF